MAQEKRQPSNNGNSGSKSIVNKDKDNHRNKINESGSCWSFLDIFLDWFFSGCTPKIITLWILIVIVDGAILFMLLVGMLNEQVTDPERRKYWIEFNSQILNALFFMFAICVQPERLYMIFLFFYNFKSCQRYFGLSNARGDFNLDESIGSSTTGRLGDTSSTIDLSSSANSDLSTSNIELSISGTSTGSSVSDSDPPVIPLLSKSKIFKILFLLQAHCVAQYILSYHMWKYDSSTRPALVIEISLLCACFFGTFAGYLQRRWTRRWFEDYDRKNNQLNNIESGNKAYPSVLTNYSIPSAAL